MHTLQEATTVSEITRTVPRINEVLENHQVDHQTSVVEVEGMLNNNPISILTDLDASLSYVSPRVVKFVNYS